jgi:ABC-type nitrate/sulfonate/bicarbonate transport system substrate-binding protein
LAATLVALAAGCTSGADAPGQPGGLEKTSIVVGAVPAADTAGMYIAQQQGFFAAAGLHVTIKPIVSAEDAQEVTDLDQGATAGFPIVGYAVTRAWEQKYPETAAAFLGALERGQAMADSDRAAVERATETFLGVPPQTAAVMALPGFPLGVDRLRLQRVADAMRRFGMLSRAFNVGPMIG